MVPCTTWCLWHVENEVKLQWFTLKSCNNYWEGGEFLGNTITPLSWKTELCVIEPSPYSWNQSHLHTRMLYKGRFWTLIPRLTLVDIKKLSKVGSRGTEHHQKISKVEHVLGERNSKEYRLPKKYYKCILEIRRVANLACRV